jgi:hypothetical protein
MEILLSPSNEDGTMIWEYTYHKLWLRVSFEGLKLVKGSITVDHTMYNIIGVDVL